MAGSWTEFALLKEILQKLFHLKSQSRMKVKFVKIVCRAMYLEYVHEICAEIVGPCVIRLL